MLGEHPLRVRHLSRAGARARADSVLVRGGAAGECGWVRQDLADFDHKLLLFDKGAMRNAAVGQERAQLFQRPR